MSPAPGTSCGPCGLFAATTTRPEIIIQGSDDGHSWRDYVFRYSPDPLTRPPFWNIPHPPRYIRAELFDYRFPDAGLRARTGQWWVRRPAELYFPQVSLADLSRALPGPERSAPGLPYPPHSSRCI